MENNENKDKNKENSRTTKWKIYLSIGIVLIITISGFIAYKIYKNNDYSNLKVIFYSDWMIAEVKLSEEDRKTIISYLKEETFKEDKTNRKCSPSDGYHITYGNKVLAIDTSCGDYLGNKQVYVSQKLKNYIHSLKKESRRNY